MLVNEDNFLLRGCQLRNTEWVLGLVVACGVDTKINFKGGGEKAASRSNAWREVVGFLVNDIVGGNAEAIMGTTSARWSTSDIMGVVVWLVVICVLGGILYVSSTRPYAHGVLWYLGVSAACDGFLLIDGTRATSSSATSSSRSRSTSR